MLHELQIHVQNKHCHHFKTSSFRMVCYTAFDNQTRDRMSISSSKYHQWKEYLWSSNIRASLVAQTVKRLSAMQETRVWSLVWEDPLKKEMAAHSSILAWRIPGTGEPGRLPSMGSQRMGHDWVTLLSYFQHKNSSLCQPLSTLFIYFTFLCSKYHHLLLYIYLIAYLFLFLYTNRVSSTRSERDYSCSLLRILMH